MSVNRKIIHIDMDAFFASVEQLDNINLRGKPVVVGGSPENRGVVAAASYEARAFGVHSAMPTSRAFKLCPTAVFVPPRFERYKEISEQIMALLREYTPLVEPLSFDEAYLDVTAPLKGPTLARELAQELRERIKQEIGLTASAGVAPNKFLAKIASDLRKPDGLTVIAPQRVEEILSQLPVKKLPGVGKVTAERLENLGVQTVAELQKLTEQELVEQFGKTGRWFFAVARGQDDREVAPERERKSIGCEDTFAQDVENLPTLHGELKQLARRVHERLLRNQTQGKTLTLKVTYADFERITRSKTRNQPFESDLEILSVAEELLGATEAGAKPIRLLGLTVSNFTDEESREQEDFQTSSSRSVKRPHRQHASHDEKQLQFAFMHNSTEEYGETKTRFG